MFSTTAILVFEESQYNLEVESPIEFTEGLFLESDVL